MTTLQKVSKIENVQKSIKKEQKGAQKVPKSTLKLKVRVGMLAHTIDGTYTISSIDENGVWTSRLISPSGEVEEFEKEKMLFPALVLTSPTIHVRRGIIREFLPVFEKNMVEEMITGRNKEVRYCSITFSNK